MDYSPTRLLCPWDSPGKSTGVGCHFLLQGVFPTQWSNPGLPRCRQMLYPPSYQGSQSNLTDVLTKRDILDTETNTRDVRTQRDNYFTKQQGADHPYTKERGLEQMPPLWPSEETTSASTLITHFQPPEPWENKFLLFKPPSLLFCSGGTSKSIQKKRGVTLLFVLLLILTNILITWRPWHLGLLLWFLNQYRKNENDKSVKLN